MTLALYGKSKRRQGSLLLLGVFAVFVAMLAGMSVYRSESASAAPVTILSDNFNGSDTNDIPNWSETESRSGDAKRNNNTAELDDNAAMYRGISTVGYTSITIEFTCRGDSSNESDDDLAVEYSTAGTLGPWTVALTLDTHTTSDCPTASFASQSVDLSGVAAANNNANFAVRFRSVGHTDSSEGVNIDNFALKGEAIPPADADGDGVSDANDLCPATTSPEKVNSSGCSLNDYIKQLNTGTGNANPNPKVCSEANFSFVVDKSGSVDSTEMGQMRTGILAFKNAYELGGVGSYRLTTFAGSSAGLVGTGYTNAATFDTNVTSAVSGSGSGATPTALGITTGNVLNGGDPDQHIMFVVTDGGPNVPDSGLGTSDPVRWVNASNDAITAANTARTNSFIVNAIWIASSDGTMPFDGMFGAGSNNAFSQAVMNQIGGGSSYTTSFSSIATDLLKASGCDPSIQKSDGTVDAVAGTVTWTVTINNLNAVAKTFTVADAGATLTGSSGCSVAPTPGAGPWTCTVAGNGNATLTLTTPLPQGFTTCQGGSGENTAYLYDGSSATGNPLGNDKGTWSHPGGVGCVTDPTISKEKASEGVTGGYAYWDVKVNNSANPNDAVGVFVKDDATLVSVSGGSCAASAGASLASGTSCTVTAGATLVVKVKKEAPTAQCLPQYINNSASVWRGTSDSGDPISPSPVGNTEATKYTIAGNASKCGQPSITKKLVNGGTEPVTVTDPNDIAWTVVVTNPATLPGAAQTVVIRDSNVIVTSGPSFTNGADCTPNNATGDFQTALTGSGVSCTMPGGASVQSTITFTVKPSGTVARECQDKPFNNTASIQIGDADPINAVGPTITLQGDAAKCTRNLEICKVVVGNGDLAVRSGAFDFGVREDGATTINGIGGLNASEPNPDNNPGANGTKVCKTVKVATDKTISVFEFGSRPANWGSDASGYPKYSINGGAQVSNNTTTNVTAGTPDLNITFYNREKLPTKNVTFQKYICDTLGDVAANDGSTAGSNDVGKPSMSATGGLGAQLNQTAAPAGGNTAVTPSNDGRGNCHLWGSDLTKYPEETGTWGMSIYDNSRSNLLQTVNIPQGGSTSVQLLDSVLLETLKASSDGARVEEELRAGYGFGSLKCYTDHLNQDNWEWLDFNPGGIPEETVYCIAYNVKADKEIVIEKQFDELPDGYTTTADDVPAFTLNPSANTSCAAPVKVNNTTWTVTCKVPYNWNGTVEETLPLPDGWEQTQCTAEARTTSQSLRFTFCNRPYAEITVLKVFVGDLTGKNFTFTGSAGLPALNSPVAGANNAQSTVLAKVKVAPGSYTLTETNGKTFAQGCQGDSALPFGYQTQAETTVDGSGVLAKQVVGANPVNITLGVGEEGVVTFYNEACAVAGSPIVIIEKFADPAGNRTGVSSITGFQIRVWNNGSEIAGSPFASTGAPIILPGLATGTVRVEEVNPNTGGWMFTGSKTDRGNNGSFEANVAGQPAQETLNFSDVVRFNFYNQPRVNIEVNKTEISLATPAGAPGNGWSFTLSGCNITPQVAVTGVNGKATFTDLPPAIGCSYTVTETVKSGWSAINPVQVTAPTAAGQTAVLNFTNVKIEVCTNCTTIVTPTPTPPTPTATATPKPSETPTSPTATPETPTQKPTEEATAGARTPGPGQTPIAPSTGNGLLGSGPAGVNMLLALVGLLAISLGTTILALGRKSSRR